VASFVSAGAHGTVPQAPAVEPVRFGPGGFGHGGFGPGGFGPGGVHRGFGHGWGHPGGFWRHGRWWNWWWWVDRHRAVPEIHVLPHVGW